MTDENDPPNDEDSHSKDEYGSFNDGDSPSKDEYDYSIDESDSVRGRNDPLEDEEEPVSGGLLAALRLVVDSIVDAEREGRTTFGGTGRIPGSHFTTEYGFSGQIGGPRSESDTQSDPGTPSEDSDRRRLNSRPGSSSTRQDEDSYLVEVRDTDDGLLVVADLPEFEIDDITAGFDEERNELVIGVENEPVERVALPWSAVNVESQFQHGVLELQLTQAEDEQ